MGRTARIGFIAYAATQLAFVAVGFWDAQVVGRIGHDLSGGIDWQLKVLGAIYLGLEVLSLMALVIMSRVPPATRARRLLVAAAIVSGVAIVVGQGQRLVLDAHLLSYERIEALLRVVSVVSPILWAASEVLLGLAAMRIAEAAGSGRVRLLAMGAIGARVIVLALQFLRVRFSGGVWIHYANTLLLGALCVALALVVTRIAEPETTRDPAAGDGQLSRQWRAPGGGITLYLGGGGARVVCALLTWLVMFNARNARGVGDLRDVASQVVVVAVLSAMATITMLAGLWRISAAPPESRASGPALLALTLALISFGLDLWGTYITVDALDGHVAAAFYAMDALPIIGGIAALVGVGVAVALLVALGNLATALGRGDVAARARGAIGYVIGAGVLLGIALAMTRMAELMLAVVVIALPLAIAALVQFLRVAFAVGREIRDRS
jgi:hypothetical protein